jgi:putative AlgH/UPF0301 family transcriptional regulator
MSIGLRIVALVTGVLAACSSAFAQGQDEAVILVAHPAFRDLEYRQTVLIAAPAPNGGHVGVILNRPTRRSLGSLFPEHEPSKKVADPVYYGGPLARRARGAGQGRQRRIMLMSDRPRHRDHAERGALFRGLCRLASR